MNDQIELIPGTNRDVSLSQWFTPPELAQRVVQWANYDWTTRTKPWRVLEPSAGNGALVRPLVAAGADVFAVELDGRYTEDLQSSGASMRWMCTDFLTLDPQAFNAFDLCVMNPPYENGLDVAFILHALKFAPRVVGIFTADLFYSQKRKRELWTNVRPTRAAFCSGRPFKGAETDYVVLELVKRENPRIVLRDVTIEWW